jgi:TRAP-type C4-dicarboxylate transport system permease small subunit
MSSEMIAEPDSPERSSAYKALYRIKTVMNLILSRFAAILLIAMTLLVLYQVFTRYVLNNPSDFTEEIVRYLLVWTGFIGAAYAFGTRQHMALIFIRNKMPKAANRGVAIGVDVLILAFALVVMIVGGINLSSSTFGAHSALLGVPRGLVYLIGPIAGAFITVGQLINIWEDVTGVSLKTETEEID